MAKEDTSIRLLFEKYLANTHSLADLNRLLHYFEVDEQPELLRSLIHKELRRTSLATEDRDDDIQVVEFSEEDREFEAMLKNVESKLLAEIRTTPSELRHRWWKRFSAVAASVLLLSAIGIGVYFYVKPSTDFPQDSEMVAGDALPGSNRATLTLADGRPIALSEQRKGIIVTTDGLTYDDGTPVEQPISITEQRSELAELSTPNGGTYHLTLPDGTKVWLNAASTITYPTSFQASERKVYLTGEAYFEVAHRNHQPFVVEVNGTKVEVLGTAFNVNAYESQPITTLVNGSVRMRNDHAHTILLPGEMSVFNGQEFVKEPANVEKISAWKDGKFYFDRDNMVEIMNELSRWYDLDVEYVGPVRNEAIYRGKISRYVNLSEVLEMLSFVGGAKFKVTEEKITILFDNQ